MCVMQKETEKHAGALDSLQTKIIGKGANQSKAEFATDERVPVLS